MKPQPSPISLSPLPARPLVSVLVTSYNYERYVREALESVLGQTYENWEAVVCDDGSTDASCEVIEGYAKKDGRIRLLKQANAGAGAALNTAFAACAGEIVCLLDADDYFMPDKLGAVVEKMRVQVGFVQHAMTMVDAGRMPIRRLPAKGVYEEGWIADRVVRRGGRWRSMPASALCFRREVADALFPVPADLLRSMADAYLYMLAPMLTEVGFIDEPLAGYCLHGTNLTGALELNPATVDKFVDGWARIARSIDRKKTEANLPVTPDLSRHLTRREHLFLQQLYGSTGVADLIKAAGPLVRQILSDDLFAPARKALGAIAFTLAPLCPPAWRVAWINTVLARRRKKIVNIRQSIADSQ